MSGSRFATAGVCPTVLDGLADVIDDARNVLTEIGARLYVVRVVRTRWSGGERYMGVEQVVAEETVLPTPAVTSMTALEREQTNAGTQETGTITVSEISPRYTENQLLGLDADGTPVPADESVYWEVQDVSPSNVDSPRRRFVLAAAPDYDELGFGWSVKLQRVQGDRTRMGEPSE